MNDAERFLHYLGENYERLLAKYRKYAHLNHYKWDDDVFHTTIVKCHDTIENTGKMADNSDTGIENYFFLSLRNNLKREGQYSRNRNKIDKDDGEIFKEWENYLKNNMTSLGTKVYNDLRKDFATLYLMQKAEKQFDAETFHAFQIKTLMNLTYRQLQQQTHIKGARTKCIEVKNWLKENVTKKEVDDAFNAIYGDLAE